MVSMKTVRMNLEDSLVDEVDRAAETLGTTRSNFAQEALRAALARMRQKEQERRHRAGYERHPVTPEEFGDWQDLQVWPD